MARHARFSVVVLLAALLGIAVAASSCGSEATTTSQTATAVSSTAPVATTAGTAAPSTTAPLPGSTSTSVAEASGVSAESLAYAESLGGTSHRGETLYVVIGASVESETEAQRALDKATPSFGDMQSYFIVQRSDGFDGLEPGWWIVIEAYYNEPEQNELDFGRRGFADAYVKQVHVLTSDPIPVYEDAVGLAEMEVIRDVIAQSGTVAAGFEVSDYLISEDGTWAGVTVLTVELETASVLLFKSGLKGWQVMATGTALNYSDIVEQGAPEEIASFLTCFT